MRGLLIICNWFRAKQIKVILTYTWYVYSVYRTAFNSSEMNKKTVQFQLKTHKVKNQQNIA
jgi:hypothetical protein